jgi:hypothetical protein
VTHIEEGASDSPLRAVFVEMKEASASDAVDTATAPAAFPNGAGKQLRDNERSILCEFVPLPAAKAHRHQSVRRRTKVVTHRTCQRGK